MWKIEKIGAPLSVFPKFDESRNIERSWIVNLVISSTVKSIVQLKKMSVSECERIAEVIVGKGGGGGEASEVITFAQLTYLKLDCLPKLTSFCLGSHSFKFPSLEEVIVT